MRDSLQRLCDEFVANRNVIKSKFKFENSYLYPVCASIFCARGVRADADKLLDAKQLLKDKTGIFSNFRGNLKLPVCSMLAAKSAPEQRMETAMDNYKLLRQQFGPSSYLALAAFFLADMGVSGSRAQEAAERGKRIHRRMKQEHRFLTSAEDSVFAVHPELGAVKDRLYELGATYAAMSGSGSTLFALSKQPLNLDEFAQEGTFITTISI